MTFETCERIAVWCYAAGHKCLVSIVEAEPTRARVERDERPCGWTTYDKLTRRSDGAPVDYRMVVDGELHLKREHP